MKSSREELQVRFYGPQEPPVLIYLPGLHGDWTLVRSFRRALANRVGFAEFTYPRTLEWSLAQYAAAVETALAAHGIRQGWLLGESYGSQLVWEILRGGRFQADGVILAGGFVQHPARWAVGLAERFTGGVSLTLITRILFAYARIARFRYRRAPEVREDIQEFIARRTELDRQAARHRLHLIAGNHAAEVARRTRVPVFALTGLLDPVVPWVFVRRWLKRNCASLRDYRVVLHADHNVLGTAPEASARLVLNWMGVKA